jgi:tetratricopeptide (TPR) repeat protein
VKDQGDYTGARRYYEHALHLYQEVGDQWGLAVVLGNLGSFYHEQGTYGAALRSCEQGLYICQVIGNRYHEGWFFGNLGWVYTDLGEYTAAEHNFVSALHIFQATGARRYESWMLASLGHLHTVQGHYAYAATLLDQARQLAQNTSDIDILGDTLLYLGSTLLGQHNYQAAQQTFAHAWSLWDDIGTINRTMEARAGLAQVSLMQGHLEIAMDHVKTILLTLTPQALVGADDPLHIYLTCYQVLTAIHDDRASAVLQTACTLLQERAATIDDEQLRHAYMHNVAVHYALLAAQAGETGPD